MHFDRRVKSLDALFIVLLAVLFPYVSRGAEPAFDQRSAAEKPAAKLARKNLELPGLVINFQKKCVDIEATICLDEGMLELIACVKGSKEHESIVAIEARPMHIHTALLLLGANNGAPTTSRPADGEETRWIHIPPQGDPVDVFLVFEALDGNVVEHPISDFVARSDVQNDKFAANRDEAEEEGGFPHTFLFAGSHLRDNGPGQRQYLADLSGNVISIATFGDELLCLPDTHTKDNSALMWQVDASELPKVGSKVTLRLRPHKKFPAKTDDVERRQSTDDRQNDQK
jgi:hypothetical protein